MHLLVTADVPFFLHARLLTADREDTYSDNSNYAADHAAEDEAQHQLLSLVKSSLYELRVPSSSRMIYAS